MRSKLITGFAITIGLTTPIAALHALKPLPASARFSVLCQDIGCDGGPVQCGNLYKDGVLIAECGQPST